MEGERQKTEDVKETETMLASPQLPCFQRYIRSTRPDKHDFILLNADKHCLASKLSVLTFIGCHPIYHAEYIIQSQNPDPKKCVF